MSDLPPQSDPAPGQALAGRYVLDARIGTGGAGVVWRAHDDVLDRLVAVKLLHPQLAQDPVSAARFRVEATAAARLTHPNAVVVFDIGQDGDRDYLVMELVDGTDLTELLHDTTLPAAVAAYVGRSVAAALGSAHRSGLVHRDVKPGNVLLTREGVPKVADFGIARAVGAAMTRLTQPGDVMGTARYVAPEQLRDHAVDGRADVYALGLVLHEALTGQPPWGDGTATEVAMRRLSSDLPPISAVRHDVPPGLEAVVARATRQDPDERHEDGSELAAALAPFVGADAPAELAARTRAVVGRRGLDDEPQRRNGPTRTGATAGGREAGVSPGSPAPGSRRPRAHPPAAAPAGGAAARPPHVAGSDRTRALGAGGAPANRTPSARGPGPGPTSTLALGGRPGTQPASSTLPPPPPSGRPRRRRRAGILLGLAIAIAAVVGYLGMVDGSLPTSPAPLSDVPVAAAADHDPLGDLREWPDRVERAFDGDADTSWQTETYERADLIPPDKDGVGIWFDLGDAYDVRRIDLELVVDGVSFEVWAGDSTPDPETPPDAWGTRVAQIDDAGDSQRVEVDGAEGRVWLLWFTELGPVDDGGFRAHVADVRFRAR